MVGAVVYAGLIVLVVWRAMRGQPIVQPDVLTLEVFATLVVSVVAGAFAALRFTRISPGSASFR